MSGWCKVAVLFAVATGVAACNAGRPLLDVKSDPPVEETRALYSDSTRITSMFGHGSQVSYSSPDGKIYLWYPGNKAVVRGTWAINKGKEYPAEASRGVIMLAENRICFNYPNSYNPATGQRGGGDCIRTKAYGKYVTELRRGDVFGLSRRQEVPFVRSGAPATIDSLLAQIPSGS